MDDGKQRSMKRTILVNKIKEEECAMTYDDGGKEGGGGGENRLF